MPARKSKVKNQRSKVQVKSQRSKISVSKKLSASVVTRKVLKANKKPATTETQKKKEAQKQGRLSIDVFDTKGKVVRSVDLPKEIFGAGCQSISCKSKNRDCLDKRQRRSARINKENL